MRILPYSLQGRFLLGLLAAIMLLGLFFSIVLRAHMQELFISEARSKANLMAAHTEAIQSYVRNVLRPAVSHALPPDEFIIEAMSTSFATRHILSVLSGEESHFIYRRVAKNARNPDYEVNDRERVFFERFTEHPELSRIEENVRVQGKEHLSVARPVYFTPDCMRCHGSPENAPAVLLKMYGATRGFWRKPHELAGLDIISVPIESSTGAIGRSITMFAVFFGSGMLLLLLIMQGFFNRLVVQNLRRVGAILHSGLFRDEENSLLAPLQREEEIEGMVRGIEMIATHLSNARRQLSEYAKNLESMVRARTRDLETVVLERSADVQLFVRLLSGLNRNVEKQVLLRTSLELIARHFNAQRAVYACGLSGSDFMIWPPLSDDRQNGLAPDEREALSRHLYQGEAALLPGVWYLPVQTSGQTRGLLGLYWETEAAAPEDAEPAAVAARQDQFPLAMAFGHQLGIALDNLDALDALLWQNSLLDSIVEGISDPLLLTERDGAPLIANASARALARRLLGHEKAGGSPADAPRDDAFLLAGLLDLMQARHADYADLAAPAQYEVDLEDGHSFAVSMYPLRTGASGVSRTVIHLRETTKEKRMVSHLRQNDKLAAVGRLASGLAHEINNPLGVIRCYAELLGKSGLDEQRRADLAVILRHVDQAQSVLRDLLDFARPHSPSPAVCDVEALLASVLEIIRPKARTSRLEITLDVPRPLGLARLDSRMLSQVIVNLLLNALDAVQEAAPPDGGRIILRAARDNAGRLIISVSDNGAGIKEKDISKIFDPFFTTKAPGAGTGLGLTVTFGMVRDMGGRLEVASPPPDLGETRMTVFTVTLPLENAEEGHAR